MPFPTRRFPGTNYTNINLDWIMRKLKEQVSTAVNSVNGKTGTVVLDATDVGALPDSYTPPAAPVDSVNGQTGTVVLDATDVGALPDTYTAPVDSVNGKTGTVVLDAADVGALPDTYTAPVTSVNGQTGAVTITAPVTSVNGQTGAVVIPQAITYDIASTFTATPDCTLTRFSAWLLSGMVFISYVITINSVLTSGGTSLFNIPDDYLPSTQVDSVGYHYEDNMPFRIAADPNAKTCYAIASSVGVGTIRGEIFWRV